MAQKVFMQYIDLTQTFDNNMPVFPGDAEPEFVKNTDVDGIVHFNLTTGMHVGTHLDAPMHMISGGKLISDYPPEKFFGRGVVIDARGKSSADENLLAGADIRPGDMVLVCFGWGGKFRDADYYSNHPVLAENFAKKLVDLKVFLVGTDTPSPDRAPYKVHKILLPRDILILENLLNLEQLIGQANFEVIALPAKFQTEAAPCRVIARI